MSLLYLSVRTSIEKFRRMLYMTIMDILKFNSVQRKDPTEGNHLPNRKKQEVTDSQLSENRARELVITYK